MVHESALRANSTFFDKALKGDWKEACDKVVLLPETDPTTFEVFVRFVYTGLLFVELPVAENNKMEEPRGEPREKWKTPTLSYRCLFMLADYLQASDLRDAILDGIIEVVVPTPEVYVFPAEVVTDIYNYTVVGAPFRKLLVDSNLRAWRAKAYERLDFTAYPPAFLADFIQASGPYITTKSIAKNLADPLDFEKACKYHEHTVEGKPCYRDKYRYHAKRTSAAVGM